MSSNTGSNLFPDFNPSIQFEDDDDGGMPSLQPAVDKSALSHLQTIVDGQTTPARIDTTSTTTAAATGELSGLPDYFKDFDEVSKQNYLNPNDDRTDYSAEALRKFGPEYSHLNTRDQIYDQTLYNKQYKDALASNSEYQTYDDIVQGRADVVSVIGDILADKLRQNFEFTQEKFEERLSIYVQDGQLTQEGRSLADKLKRDAVNLKGQIESEAKTKATQKVSEYSQYRTVVDDQIKNFKPFGIDLPEEMRSHIREIITSGKSKQVPQTTEEKAQREILEAILSDKKAGFEFIRMIDARGIEHGTQKAAKTNFRSN